MFDAAQQSLVTASLTRCQDVYSAAKFRMTVYEISPTTDARWENLLQSHRQASIFHTRGWLEALHRTYGYTPIAFTTSPPGCPLTNAIPFCRVSGFLGTQRLVSLPFSDHCEPLVENSEQLSCLLTYLRQRRETERWDYIELRPKSSAVVDADGFSRSQSFLFHELDLRRNLDELRQNTHKDCIQRKLRRAEREGLTCEQGTSDSLLRQFYQLLIRTRRRHGVPAQPIQWFHNLIACMGDKLTIRVASQNGHLVASILTLRFKHDLVFKYGCSDYRFHKLGGVPWLLWRAIQDAKDNQLWTLDLGRSDSDNAGLIAFKNRWRASSTELTYNRCPAGGGRSALRQRQGALGRYILSHTPLSILGAVGKATYKYAG